ncbi:hypothetical protein [Marinicella sp. W31]|uniref:hypothetical protein n=1 Tax=Marinicella sp. W31 TaxID=3023713 RepID=UPI0037574169
MRGHKSLLITFFCFSFFISGNLIAASFDIHGKLITPDMAAMKQGLDQQKDGYIEAAMKHFSHAAKFGNNDAKYMIGMYHFSKKDWPRGYAWLNLMSDANDEQKAQMESIKTLITDQEKHQAAQIYIKLKAQYSPLANLEYRQAWASAGTITTRARIKSPVRSVNSYSPSRTITMTRSGPEGIIQTDIAASVDPTSVLPGEQLYSQINDYVFEIENSVGEVVLGDLELIDTNE